MRAQLFLAGAAIAASATILAGAGSASATTMYSSESAWDTAVTYHVGTSITGDADGSHPTTVTLAAGTKLSNFSSPITTHIVGTSWSTWPGQPGSNGTTVYNDGTSLSMKITDGAIFAFGQFHPVNAFGFYIEPDPFSVYNITLTLSDGSNLTQSVDGNAGAKFFGWTDGGVTSLTISSAADFGFGQFSEGSVAVPEPATWALMIGGFGLAGMALRRRRMVVAA
jgi:hypothetical protein